ncbi:MAG: sodium:calcium antiporter [Candidatus Binataceae bacterium]
MSAAASTLALTGAIVVLAGVMLGRAADRIAELTGVGEMWTGWLMLAAATSLPEFVTDVSAVKLHAADLAGGDLFGSSLANMAILALIAFACSTPKLNNSASLFSAYLAIVLNLLGTFFTLLHSGLTVAHVSVEPLLIVLVYLLGTRALYRRSTPAVTPSDGSAGPAGGRQSRLCWAFLVFALGVAMIFFSAPRFAASAKNFAALSGLGESLVGTWLLGFSTALPELVTSLTVARLGAFDLAVANLYGSCAFNMVVFFAMDLASPTPVFASLDPGLAVAGFLAVLLMVLGVLAISYRRQHAAAWYTSSGLLLASYGTAIWLLYLLRGI